MPAVGIPGTSGELVNVLCSREGEKCLIKEKGEAAGGNWRRGKSGREM